MTKFIDELREINEGLGAINEHEQRLINEIKAKLTKYVSNNGMNGKPTGQIAFTYDSIKKININKVIKHMVEEEGLTTFEAYIDENRQHDILVRHWFDEPKVWFSVDFKNLK